MDKVQRDFPPAPPLEHPEPPAVVPEERPGRATFEEIRNRKTAAGKREWRLLPLAMLRGVADVFSAGARKYAPFNWMAHDRAHELYYDAAIRHIDSWASGETLDPDDGLHALDHAIACLLILRWHDSDQGQGR